MRSVTGIRRAAMAVVATLAMIPLSAVATLHGGPDDPSEHSRRRLPYTPLPDTSLTTVKSPHNRCLADDPADHWRIMRFLLTPLTADGPPELTEAVTALNRDNSEQAQQLLDRVGFFYFSDSDALEHRAPAFQKAVRSAHILAWNLRGCPRTRDGMSTLFWE